MACIIIFLFLCVFGVRAQIYEGQSCVYRDGSPGLCKKLENCARAIADQKSGFRPTICSFSGSASVVCCSEVAISGESQPINTIGTNKPNDHGCPPLPPNVTTLTKTGRKAIDKCIDYLDLVYPCERDPLTSDGQEFRDPAGKCGSSVIPLITGGNEAQKNEFPHVVALGFGDNGNEISWLCGGSLVSEFYVLTAAHCTFSHEFGAVAHVLLGDHNGDIDPQRLHSVSEIIKHPGFKAPQQYNDIALIKLDRKALLDSTVRPACLPTEKTINSINYIVSAWVDTSYPDHKGKEILLMEYLTPISNADCSIAFPLTRRLREGIIDDQQLCVGSNDKSLYARSSGWPLQVRKPNIFCMFDVIGVSSFGYSLGNIYEVYTRVSTYTPWIEGVIWP